MKKIVILWVGLIFLCCINFNANFSGTWEITWEEMKGELIIRQKGNYVEGEYLYMSLAGPAYGIIKGQVKGDTLFFTEYRDVGDTWKGMVIMGEDRNSFKGYTYLMMGRYMRWFDGKRISKEVKRLVR